MITLNVNGRKFVAQRDGSFKCGDIRVKWVDSCQKFLATAPGMSATGPSMYIAVQRLGARALAVLQSLSLDKQVQVAAQPPRFW